MKFYDYLQEQLKNSDFKREWDAIHGKKEMVQMYENKNTMMLAMCMSKVGGFGCEYKGNFYFYEGTRKEAIDRILNQIQQGTFTLYTMTWARRTRVAEVVEHYNSLPDGEQKFLVELVAMRYISDWSCYSTSQAIDQLRKGKVDYEAIH